MAEQKYYWLKLKRDFFRRNEIEVVKAMPSGTDYVLFYLELLLLSLDHGDDSLQRFDACIGHAHGHRDRERRGQHVHETRDDGNAR